MRVTFNTFPDTLLGRLQSLGGEQNKALTQLSTGQRIAAPSDDAPAMQRILNLRTEKNQNQQFYRNATDGLEISKVTFSSLDQIKDLVVRSSELSAGVNGATSDQEYKAKASEINQLIEQGLNVANTKLRGNYLFAGDANSSIPFAEVRVAGKISSIAYNGSSSESKIHVGEGDSGSIIVGSSADENRAIADALNKLIELRKAMEAAPSATKAESVMSLRAEQNVKFSATSPAGDSINFPADIAVGDIITFDFAVGEGGPLESGKRYYVVNTSTGKGVSETPSGSAVSFAQAISSSSSFSKVRLDTAEDTILSALSRAGTIQYRLETVQKDLELRYESSEKLISTDADVDFAEATVRLNRSQMAYQAAIQSGAKIQNNSLLDYLR